jgi:hypothetical protein
MTRNWKRALLAGVLVGGALAASSWNGRADATKKDDIAPDMAALRPSSDGQAHIDVVFAIDCSGSMGPVIETAKKKVWTIVNEIAKARPAPVLRIGLIGYGDADRVFRSFPLSDDLDTVYGNLMTFKDEGWSDEYVGLAVHKAVTEMNWSQAMNIDLKVIYVLGNETARQGPKEFDYGVTAPQAAAKNIIVNAIYCNARRGNINNMMNNAPGVAPRNSKSSPPAPQQQQAVTRSAAASTPLDGEVMTWMEMALLGKGKFLEIAGDGGAITIPTPYDKVMIALNTALNDTYIPYGARGPAGKANQLAQDSNATAVGGMANAATRVQAKGGGLYNNRGWDLVDASREKDFDWSKVRDEDLPVELRGKSAEERKQLVEQHAQKRAALQAQLGALGRKRDEYTAAEIKKQNLNTGNAFDDAVRRTIIEQGNARGFVFK